METRSASEAETYTWGGGYRRCPKNKKKKFGEFIL